MLLERMFSSTFGIVWLVIFIGAVLLLIVWFLLFKDKKTDNLFDVNNEKNVEKEPSVVEDNSKDEVLEKVEKKEIDDYFIVASDDGFFRVKKSGSDRALRKFSTRIEAENFIEKRKLTND